MPVTIEGSQPLTFVLDTGADADLGVDGLLGGDVLSAFGTFTLDYGEGVLVLEDAPPPEAS